MFHEHYIKNNFNTITPQFLGLGAGFMMNESHSMRSQIGKKYDKSSYYIMVNKWVSAHQSIYLLLFK